MLSSALVKIWVGVVLAAAGIGSLDAAATQTRTESAAEVKETADVFNEYRRKRGMEIEGELRAGPAEIARFQAAFARAVALYEERPDDAAALTALTYSTGDTIEQVIDFQKKKVSMPWVNWHQDTASRDYFRLGLDGLPSYLVLDKNGAILARGKRFDAALKEKIRTALAAAG